MNLSNVLAFEPEVISADLSRIRCKSLASLILRLIEQNEPLLSVERDGATLTVRERGGSGVMRLTVEAV